jgi:hypothetical protein
MLDLEWTYGLGNNTAVSTNKQDLEDNLVNTNVAIDIFADPDKSKATDTEKAKMEIMVWFAAYGPATQPLGMAETGKIETKVVEGNSLYVKPCLYSYITLAFLTCSSYSDLYTGENAAGQKVFTWYTETPLHKYNGDLMLLLDILLAKDDSDYPRSSDYIGYMSLGSEALSANKTVTFHVPKLAIDVQTK